MSRQHPRSSFDAGPVGPAVSAPARVTGSLRH
jgi:hypothetical protein